MFFFIPSTVVSGGTSTLFILLFLLSRAAPNAGHGELLYSIHACSSLKCWYPSLERTRRFLCMFTYHNKDYSCHNGCLNLTFPRLARLVDQCT